MSILTQRARLLLQKRTRVLDGDLDEAERVADQLGTTYANTSYAAQSKLAIARLYMDKNRDQDAADALTALIDGDASEELRQVARLRLARILLYQDKPQDVVDLLDGQESPAFAAPFAELLGDAYYALGRIADWYIEVAKVRVRASANATGSPSPSTSPG